MVKIGAELPKLSEKIKLGIRFWTTLYVKEESATVLQAAVFEVN